MIIQSDADNTIYHGNLLINLGWRYLGYLFNNKKYLQFTAKLIELPLFCIISIIPGFMKLAFIPFRDCPISLIDKLTNKINKKWLNKIKELKPDKIIIITNQESNILKRYLKRLDYNFEIISNTAEIKDNEFTGKFKINITPFTKSNFIKKDLIFLGDIKDYMLFRNKVDRFIII